MIKKLNNRIFFLIMISFSIVVLGIIILFAILNYKNTINTAVSMIDRVANFEIKKNTEKMDEDKLDFKINIDGLYVLLIEDSKVIENSDTTRNKTIEEYAIKASNQNKENGIIGNYIYKARKGKRDTVNVILMKDEETILHLKKIIIISVIFSLVSLIVIYVLAKKVSKFIVKPVEETFEKQKQFISDASHELKTPLAIIEANSDVLENEIGNNKWLTYIQNETESMNKLINELLLLAKIENIDNISEYKKFDLSKEVEIIVSMFESVAYEKKVKMRTIIQDNVIMNGNKEDIEHILSTLIDNAIKHAYLKKEVIIELVKNKNEIILNVKNMGNSIPEEERKNIFERFYRIDKSRNRNEKRYGLGLSIAKSTVEKYKGNIEVSCEDGFTIFTVVIPN